MELNEAVIVSMIGPITNKIKKHFMNAKKNSKLAISFRSVVAIMGE